MYKNISVAEDRIVEDKMSNFINSFDLKVVSFSKWGHGPDRIINDFIITDYDLLFINKGELVLTDSKETVICKEGSIILLEPFTKYSAERPVLKDMEFYNIYFDISPESRKKLLLQSLLGNKGKVFEKDEIFIVHNLVSKLYDDSLNKKRGLIISLESTLKLVVIEMMRSRISDELIFKYDGIENKDELMYVNMAIEIIKMNKEKSIKIGDLSRELNISESFLYKIFINVLGISPSRYIMQYKIKCSKELLQTTPLSVGEISHELGFSSPYHFSNTFKKFMGVSPREFIKRINKG